METMKPFNYWVGASIVEEEDLSQPCVFLSVAYNYKDSKGTHRVTIPKIYIPLENGFSTNFNKDSLSINLDNHFLWLCKSDCADNNGVKHEGVYFLDEIIEPAKPKKMTVTDIEKQLGYKIEIVSEEHN